MQEAKKTANRMLAEKMIEKLKLRRMEGFYVETKEEALALVKEKFLHTREIGLLWRFCYLTGNRNYGLAERKSVRCN